MKTTQDNQASAKRSVYPIAVTIGFCVCIALPCIGTLFGWDLYPRQDENRAIAQLPDMDETTAAQFPKAFERYFKDHFGFRNTLVRRYRKLRQKVVGRSKDVLVGKNGWLFYTRQNVMNDYRGEILLTDVELAQWRRVLESKADWLKKQGVDYVFAIAPNKVQVYPEHLPDEARVTAGKSRADQIVEYLEAHSDVTVVHLKRRLLAEKSTSKKPLYFPNDTHWNDHGSLVAQQEIVAALRSRLPNAKALTLKDCVRRQKKHRGDLSVMAGLTDTHTLKRIRLLPKSPNAVAADSPLGKGPSGDLPIKSTANPKGTGKILFYHDSFGLFGLKLMLPEVFAETTLIQQYPDGSAFKDHLATTKPDVVIELFVERQLDPNDSDAMKQWFKPLEE